MARIVRHTDQGPPGSPLADLKTDRDLCRCGLSQHGAFCDGSHKATRDEKPGATYEYTRDGGALLRSEVQSIQGIPTAASEVAAQPGGAA
jgi:CDGSH-type Zn-finger protein